MTRKEYENEVREKIFDVKNEFDKKLLELHKELMAEFKEEPSLDGWKVGDKYYFHDTLGKLHYDILEANIADEVDNRGIFRITHGYAKHTLKEVEFQIERDAVLYELSKFAEPEDREWDGSLNDHWYMYWNCSKDEIKFDFNYKNKHNDIYFASREDAEKAIQAVGEERIKKYYLEVKE